MSNSLERGPGRSLAVWALIAGLALAQGTGHPDGPKLATGFNGRLVSDAAKPIESGVFDMRLADPSGSRTGAPVVVVADFQPVAERIFVELPGELGVIGVGPAFFVLVDGTGTLAPTPASGGSLAASPTIHAIPLSLPESASLPAHMSSAVQAFALDPAMPAGLAISRAVQHHTELLPDVTTITNLSPGVDAIQGYAMATGDVNGDGIVDLVIGSPRARPGGLVEAGEVRIHLGPDQQSTLVLTAPTPATGAFFGGSLAVADVDADGKAELVVGAPYEIVSGITDAGAAYVFANGTLALVARVESPNPVGDGRFGHALTTLDHDGDGHVDLAIGEPKAPSAGLSSVGRVHLFAGPSFLGGTTLENPAPQAGARFGYALAAGDLDGNGTDELVAAAPYHDQGGGNDNSGVVHVFGSASPSPTFSDYHPLDVDAFHGAALEVEDVDRDGHLDLVAAAEFADASTSDDGALHVLYGPGFAVRRIVGSPTPQVGGGFGGSLALGDVNGDRWPDLVVGEFYADVGGLPDAGRGWVLHGPHFETSTELLAPEPAAHAFAGRRVESGDLDGDGFAEAILGAPFASPGGAVNHYAGAVHLFR